MTQIHTLNRQNQKWTQNNNTISLMDVGLHANFCESSYAHVFVLWLACSNSTCVFLGTSPRYNALGPRTY